jgi:phenylpropionate dioxygenase-like ring-hydroxylating dioxygenase large terminal subunit
MPITTSAAAARAHVRSIQRCALARRARCRRGGPRDDHRCPLHGWSYALDGRLLAAPQLPGIRRASFDKSRFSLHPVSVRTWGGFVFLNLTPETAPMSRG